MIAGVGVLLIAMGVGVLIGRASSGSTQTSAPPQVITVGSSPVTGATTTGSSTEASFTDDWPSATNGYTVQLESLPQTGTTVAAVEQAKTTDTSKGAKNVGALRSEDFSSLTAGNYVVYSGVYKKKPEAEKALTELKKNFPGASVIEVSTGASNSSSKGSSPSSSSPSGGSGKSAGSAPSKNSGASHAKTTNPNSNNAGKSFEEKSKSLPNEVET